VFVCVRNKCKISIIYITNTFRSIVLYISIIFISIMSFTMLHGTVVIYLLKEFVFL